MCDTCRAYEYMEVGVSHEREKDHCRALDCYEKALELAPTEPELWLRKGLVLQVIGWDEEADMCLDRYLALVPLDTEM